MNILNITYSLPEKREMLAETAIRLKIPKAQANVFHRLFGLNKFPIDLDATQDKFMLEAAKECIESAGIDKRNIKYLIHAHTANHGAPFGVSSIVELQQKLGLINAVPFGTALNKCGSVFVSFKVANDLFDDLADHEYILILTGDISFTKLLQIIPGTTITTDGACAILLTKNSENNKLIGIEIDVYGEFAGGVWDESIALQLFEKNYSNYLADVIKKVINNANLSIQNVKMIFPHNVNTISWKQVIKLLQISPNRVYLKNVGEIGHCFGTDPFLNYKCAFEEGCIEKGDFFIFATVGLGATFAAMLFQY